MDGDGPLGCSVDATCAVWNGWATGAAGTARGNVCEWVPWRTKTPGRNIGHQLDFNRKNRPPTQSRRSHCIADRRRIEDARPAPSAAGSKPESVPCAERGYPPRLQVSASDLTGPSRAWGATVRPPPTPARQPLQTTKPKRSSPRVFPSSGSGDPERAFFFGSGLLGPVGVLGELQGPVGPRGMCGCGVGGEHRWAAGPAGERAWRGGQEARTGPGGTRRRRRRRWGALRWRRLGQVAAAVGRWLEARESIARCESVGEGCGGRVGARV